MSRIVTAVAAAAAGAAAYRLFSRPRRGDLWRCGTCGAMNEPDRAKCMNGCS